MDCHLVIPSLFPPPTVTRENDPLAEARAPALEALLARGSRERHPPRDLESWLCAAFGVARGHDYPLGSLRLLADGINPGDRYWLCADPVHLAVERERLVLSHAAPRADEADSLTAALNRHFAPEGMHFAAPRPERWYLRAEGQPLISTHSLSEAAGKDINALLPTGPDAMRWRALLNEMQMVLFGHPVNAAREARGEPPVNSVWPWGGGLLPHRLQRPFDRLWARDAVALGCALAGAVAAQSLPEDATAWLASARGGRHLVVLDHLALPAAYGNHDAWRESLAQLERAWFAPLKRAVAAGRITLAVHAPTDAGTLDFAITRRELWKLWRPAHVLRHYRR